MGSLLRRSNPRLRRLDKPMDECAGWTRRSSQSARPSQPKRLLRRSRQGGCFGGFRRRNEGYPGCKPGEASCATLRYIIFDLGMQPAFLMDSCLSSSPPALFFPGNQGGSSNVLTNVLSPPPLVLRYRKQGGAGVLGLESLGWINPLFSLDTRYCHGYSSTVNRQRRYNLAC